MNSKCNVFLLNNKNLSKSPPFFYVKNGSIQVLKWFDQIVICESAYSNNQVSMQSVEKSPFKM